MRNGPFNFLWVLFLILFSFGALLGQNTAPVPTNFTIIDRGDEPAYRDLLKFPVNPVLRGDVIRLDAYSVNYGNAVDSVYFPVANRTSVEGETKYDVAVKSIGLGYANNDTAAAPRDSIATIEIRKRNYRTDSTATVVVWLNQANRDVIDYLGWTFNNTVSVGDKFRVVLTYDYLMSADKNGRLETAAQLTDGDSVLLSDPLSRAFVTLDWEQYTDHNGYAFVSGDSSVINANEFLDLIMVVPADTTTSFHVVFSAGGSDAINMQMFESVNDSINGDTLTMLNRRRDHINTSDRLI